MTLPIETHDRVQVNALGQRRAIKSGIRLPAVPTGRAASTANQAKDPYLAPVRLVYVDLDVPARTEHGAVIPNPIEFEDWELDLT